MTKIHPPFDTRAMATFLQVARDASFTLAGARLGMTPSAVSKAIGRLEMDLGATLFHRNARSVSLTPAGLRFLAEAEQLALAIERARHVVADRAASPRGTLRITMPIHFGRTVVTPHLRRFCDENPSLDLEILLTNAQLDPVEHNIDIAVWLAGGAWIDPRLVIQDVASYDTLLCAAPSYLERYGTPHRIGDLDHHKTLAGIDDKTGRIFPWIFHDGERRVDYVPRHQMLSNAIELLLDVAMDGGGIVYLPEHMAHEPLRLGRLRVVLPQYRLDPTPAQIIYPRHRAQVPGVAPFVELLLDIFDTRRAAMNRQRRMAAG